jgi:nitrite reductase/ring-hydroxylating ferredoxin subunit
VVAFEDRCPHRGTPLSRGTLAGTTLTCAAHTWEFDVRTGQLLRLRAPACLTMLQVRERAGSIELGRAA